MKKISKCLMSLLITVGMFFSMSPLSIMAEENDLDTSENVEEVITEEVPVEESQEENIEVLGYDITKPVFEGLSIDKQGQTVDAGSYIVFSLNAYDADSEITKVQLQINQVYQNSTMTNTIDLMHVSDHLYQATYTIPDRTEKLIVSSLTITDSAGNSLEEYFNENEYFLNVIPKEPESVEPGKITKIQFERNHSTITQGEDVPIAVFFDSVEGIQNVTLSFVNGRNTYNCSLYNYSVESKEFIGYIQYQEYQKMISGTYVLDKVNVYTSDFKTVEYSVDEFGDFDFVFELKDNKKPEITAVTMEPNKEVVVPGDVIKFSVTAKDNDSLSNSCQITLSNINDTFDSRQIYLSYDETTKKYVGTYTIQETDYPTEWYVYQVSVSDKYGNNEWITSLNNKKLQDLFYFNVKNKDTSVNPVYKKVRVVFYDSKGNIDEQVAENVERRTTFKEVGFDFNVKAVSPIEGLSFVDWVDSNGIVYDENSEIAPDYVNEQEVYYSFTPKFDKNIITLNVTYVDKNGEIQYSNDRIAISHNMTYKELIEYLNQNASLVGDIDESLFNGFEIAYYNGDDTEDSVIRFNSYVSVLAPVKDKTMIQVYYSYLGKDGLLKAEPRTLSYDKGVSFEKVKEDIINKEAPELYPGLRFANWKMYDGINAPETLTDPYYSYAVNAKTENCYVRYVIDPYFEDTPGFGATAAEDEKYERSFVGVYEKGETAVVPSSFEGYEKVLFRLVNYEQGGEFFEPDSLAGKEFVVDKNFSYFGYGTKCETPDPEEPDEPDPTPDPEPEVPVLPEETVTEIVEEIESSQNGDTVTVDMTEATTVPDKVIDAVSGKDVDVVLDMGDYTWTINGKDVLSSDPSNINLEVKFDTAEIPDKVVNDLANGAPVKQLSLTHEGNFGFKGTLNFYMGKEYAGQYGHLYYYDSDGKMVYQHTSLIDEEGYASYTFSHASDYLVVIDQDETPSQDQGPVDSQEPESPDQVENSGQTENTNDANKDTQKDKTNTKKNKDVKTSVQTNVSGFGFLMVLAVAGLIATRIKFKNR